VAVRLRQKVVQEGVISTAPVAHELGHVLGDESVKEGLLQSGILVGVNGLLDRRDATDGVERREDEMRRSGLDPCLERGLRELDTGVKSSGRRWTSHERKDGCKVEKRGGGGCRLCVLHLGSKAHALSS
jgi:hypothetical protein